MGIAEGVTVVVMVVEEEVEVGATEEGVVDAPSHFSVVPVSLVLVVNYS